MGFEQIADMKAIPLKNFAGGWFPKTEREEVPDNASPECQNVIWFRGTLRPFFGCSKLNSAQVDSGASGNGTYHASFGTTNRMIAVFGDKFYESTDGASWTDRTGGMTITDGYPWQFRTFEEGTNKYVIMCNGEDAPLKWTGAGNNAELLGGSPSAKALSHDYWHSYYWMTDTTNDSWAVRSGLTNPQTWALTTNFWPFQRKVYGIQANKQRIAIIMEDSIGYVAGFGQDSFHREVDAISIGSKATRTLAEGFYNIRGQEGSYQSPGFYFVGNDSVYFITEDFQKINVTPQLKNWWNTTTGTNRAVLSTSFGCYHEDYNWYVFAVPVGTSTQPDYLFILDANTGAVWPMPQPLGATAKIRGLAIFKDSNNDDWICIQDDDGYAYKFDPTVLNYDGSAIEAKWKSKDFDLGAIYELREPQLEAKIRGDYTLDLYINFDHEIGDGSYDTMNLIDNSDVLTTSFTLGSSTLGGKDYIFDYVEVTGQGRFFEFTLKDFSVDNTFDVVQAIFWFKFIRKGSLV